MMADIRELTETIKRAKADPSTPITITAGDLHDLMEFVGVISDLPAPPPEVRSAVDALVEHTYITIEEVCADLKMSRTTLLELRRAGKFVSEIKRGERRVLFLRTEYQQWKLTPRF